MMINRAIGMLFFVVSCFSAGVANVNTDTLCTKKRIESFLSNAHYSHSFKEIFDAIPDSGCSNDTSKVVTVLLQILSNEKLGSNYSADQKNKFFNAFNIINFENYWVDQFEKEVKRRQIFFKERNVSKYYWYTALIIKNSREYWYQYAEEVYLFKDTVYFQERNDVYDAILEKISTKNNSEVIKLKIESLLYSVLKKEINIEFYGLDTYMSTRSEVFKNSKQRYEIIKKFKDHYLNKKKQTGYPFDELFGYIKNVETYYSTLKETTDYTPPINIE